MGQQDLSPGSRARRQKSCVAKPRRGGLFWCEAKRTLELGGKFCWVGAFSLWAERGSRPHIFLCGSRGSLRRSEKNHPHAALFEAAAAVFFSSRPLSHKENRPTPPRFESTQKLININMHRLFPTGGGAGDKNAVQVSL